MRQGAGLLSFAAAFLCATAARADSYYQKYLPLKKGNSWTYQNTKWGGEFTNTADQAFWGIYHFDKFVAGGDDGAWVGFAGNTLYVWNADAGEWREFLRFGAPTGTTYTIDLGNPFFSNVKVTVASKSAVVWDKWLQQKFYKCVVFSFGPVPGLYDAGTTHLTFAPNVGLLESGSQSIAGPVTAQLKSAVVNGKKIGPISFTGLEKGGTGPASTSNKVLLFKTQAAWSNWYLSWNPEGIGNGTAPVIDFSKKSVVAVLAGNRPTGGYGVSVTLVRWNFPWSSAKVYVRETKPSANVIVTMATTRPYQIIVLDEKVTSVTKVWTVVEYFQ